MLLERQTPYTYTAKAYLLHPTEKRGYGSGVLVVRAGSRESTRMKCDGFDATFTVTVGRNRDQATTRVEITRNGEFVTRQTSVIQLADPHAR
jgi:hypothetical protein